jgi:acetyl esterase/lipase
MEGTAPSGAVAGKHTSGGAATSWSVTRLLAGAIGVGSVGVGSFQYGAPRRAARRFGIELGSDATSAIMMRGVGARDCLTGSALLYSAVRGRDYRPWLAMRAGADAADGIAGALSLRAAKQRASQARATRLALVLSGVELLLWWISTRELDPIVFESASVPDGTLAITERLRRDGAAGPALSAAHIQKLRRSPPDAPGVLRAEPLSELAAERVIDGPAGPLRLRVFRSGEVRACYLHLHGGGWALGSPDSQDQTLWRLASAGGLAVVSVDYRLAPEHPHPAARDDCVAAIRWLVANGQRELGAARLIVAGESAGAHLAALALLALRDVGEIEAVAAANLAYGVYDVSMTPSARRWGGQRLVISTPDLAFFAQLYAPSERHRDADISPLYADLIGLPPALFSCGTLDPLLDDTLFMAARWQAAGSDAQLAIYPGAPHEFLNLREPISAEAQARERMLDFIEHVLTDNGLAA